MVWFIRRGSTYTTSADLNKATDESIHNKGGSRGSGIFTSLSFLDEESEERVVYINRPAYNRRLGYCGNHVRTTKYTLLTFLPKNLFEQFHRYANIYFLVIAILNWMPFIQVFKREITFLPLTFVLSVTAIKDAYEDRRRHNMDKEVNNRLCTVLKKGQPVSRRWAQLRTGDVVMLKDGDMIPADIVILKCSDPQGVAYIETANLDGETNLKQRIVVPHEDLLTTNAEDITGKVTCDLPHSCIYDFNGYYKCTEGAKPVPLDASNLLLRGCALRNTEWVIGVVAYAGADTKAMLNNSGPRSKRSKLERQMNKEILLLWFILLIMCGSCAVGSGIWMSSFPYTNTLFIPFAEGDPDPPLFAFLSFWSNIILFNVMVPISLYVTLELIKLGQVYFMVRDPAMRHPLTGKPMSCRALNINEDLGQIQYIFSDKTGTLTENKMVFKRCGVGAETYGANDHHDKVEEATEGVADTITKDPRLVVRVQSSAPGQDVYEFFTMLAICNTVLPRPLENGDIRYEAESPDEAALVDAAKEYGFRLVERTQNRVVVIDPQGRQMVYNPLNVLTFTSERKRMSTIYERPDGSIVMYTKGADGVIYDRLDQAASSEIKGVVTNQLNEFSCSGLRTLCLAKKEINAHNYKCWAETWSIAACSLHNRNEQLDELAEEIEKGLTLLGSTGIEDRLQQGVPNAIKTLRAAGIRVWVLTGDKQETAINIAFSSRLVDEDMNQILLNANSSPEARAILINAKRMLTTARPDSPANALVVDGRTLTFALAKDLEELFVDVACRCEVVLCCRTAPLQKAMVVQSVKKNKKVMTLAIGDGANDVSMIQCADVGVGISGNEGMQAVMASDFAVARFRFLTRLLLVHGHWNYHRITNTVLYFFFKNSIFVYLLLWFQFFCGFSGQTAINQYYLMTYNLLFTSVPIIMFAIFDQDVSEDKLLKYPFLYYVGRSGRSYTRTKFWLVMLGAVWCSLWIFLIGYMAYRDSDVDIWEFGTTLNTGMIIVVTLQLYLMSKHITWINAAALIGSVVLYFTFMFVFALLPTELEGVAYVAAKDPRYWSTWVLAVVLAMLPQYIVEYVRAHEFPEPVDIVREHTMLERKPRTMPSHIPHIYPDTVAAGSDDGKDVKLVEKVFGSTYPTAVPLPQAVLFNDQAAIKTKFTV